MCSVVCVFARERKFVYTSKCVTKKKIEFRQTEETEKRTYGEWKKVLVRNGVAIIKNSNFNYTESIKKAQSAALAFDVPPDSP